MTLRTDIVLGLDVGTTSAKAVARAASRPGAPYVEQLTPWHTHGCGQTEIDSNLLLDLAIDLIGRATAAVEAAWQLTQVLAPRSLSHSGCTLVG